ncbi:MAG: divergent polysaccharide deacetylase family protein [Thermoanaerobaculia bacterium]|nr:divergent polysaccharide deacetylase family protein [Thermoanaerobaculia bacterium]
MVRKSKRQLSVVQKTAVALVAATLFAGGLYMGVQLAKPPPAPDLEGLLSGPAVADASETDTGRATESTTDREPGRRLDSDPASRQVDGTVSVPKASGDPTSPPVKAPEPQHRPGPGFDAPKIALVIDDLGRSLRDVDRLESLDIPITFSVLPYEGKTKEVVAALHSRGFEYLCHLPMEAKSSADPGPGAIGPGMSREELRAATQRALDAVPGAKGVNNHMGSAVMSDRRAAFEVLTLVARRGLYFVDSRTSVDTLGYSLARELGVPAAERQVFLDSSRDQESIRQQWAKLLHIARERGAALAIAHPHDETLSVLTWAVPLARGEGFDFVTASALLEP